MADANKPKITLVDPAFICSMAEVLGQGEVKHGVADWKTNPEITYTRVLDAVRRHLAAIEQGEDTDPETGEGHAAHAACGLMFMDWYGRNYDERRDDRRFKPQDSVPRMRLDEAPDRVRPLAAGEVRPYLQPVQEPQTQRAEEGEAGAGRGDDRIAGLQDRIRTWANRVFPNRTAENALHKLIRDEIPELLHGGINDEMEWADLFILAFDIADLLGIDPIAAAHRKMSVNEARRWQIVNGLLQHIGEDPAPPAPERWMVNYSAVDGPDDTEKFFSDYNVAATFADSIRNDGGYAVVMRAY